MYKIVRTGPGADSEHSSARGICSIERSVKRRRLVLHRLLGHSLCVASFNAIREDHQLSGGISGDEQLQWNIGGRIAEGSDLSGTEMQSIPSIAGVGLKSLGCKRLAQIDDRPCGIV